jgi:hypothetical protein
MAAHRFTPGGCGRCAVAVCVRIFDCMAVLLVFVGTCSPVNARYCRLSAHVGLSPYVIVACVGIFECLYCCCSLCVHVRLFCYCFFVHVCLYVCVVALMYVYPNRRVSCCCLSMPVRLFYCCECAHALCADSAEKMEGGPVKDDRRCRVPRSRICRPVGQSRFRDSRRRPRSGNGA